MVEEKKKKKMKKILVKKDKKDKKIKDPTDQCLTVYGYGKTGDHKVTPSNKTCLPLSSTMNMVSCYILA